MARRQQQAAPFSPQLDLSESRVTYVSHQQYTPGHGGKARLPQWTMSLTLGGRGRTLHPKGMSDLETGDWILVQPGILQHWLVPEHDESGTPLPYPHWLLTHAVFQPRPHWHEYVRNLEVRPGIYRRRLTGACLRDVRRAMALAWRAFRHGGLRRDQWVLLHLERVLLRLYDEQPLFDTPLDSRVRQAVEYIHRHLQRRLSLEEIAAAGFISVSHLLELFRTQMGTTPMVYVEKVRMRQAEEMLKYSFYPVAQIATLLGYEHPSYFVQRFRKTTGLTPLAYRKASRASGHNYTG